MLGHGMNVVNPDVFHHPVMVILVWFIIPIIIPMIMPQFPILAGFTVAYNGLLICLYHITILYHLCRESPPGSYSHPPNWPVPPVLPPAPVHAPARQCAPPCVAPSGRF